MLLEPNTTKPELDPREASYFVVPNEQLLSNNIPWVKCTTLVTPDNIDNFVVRIPRDVCIDQVNWALKNNKPKAALGLWMSDTVEPQPLSKMQWYAIPMDHIMATYCYAPKAMLAQRDIECHLVKFRRGNGPVRGFFLMTDQTYLQLRKQLIDKWLSRKDIRPLNQVSFEAVPVKLEESITQPVTLKTVIQFVAWPNMNGNQRMMPTTNADLVALAYYELFKDPKQRSLLKQMLPKK